MSAINTALMIICTTIMDQASRIASITAANLTGWAVITSAAVSYYYCTRLVQAARTPRPRQAAAAPASPAEDSWETTRPAPTASDNKS
ncbi:hypothetical protein QBC36DRAFT_295081 [Triangularia setosa]|uniref:Uncharacterized protein n=1 Tax=Triangularia setosa TaxID=2587417 RepID=A0AAN7A3C8_9PEZI|nr:hypothetical protein QBC36DRAFT_295081 [Podospora setosa]